MKSHVLCLVANESSGISLNTDIFETNIVNIVLLLGILFVVIKNFLTENLTARKNKIVEQIENAESRLSESNKRYSEAKKQWSQMDIIVKEINSETEVTKQNILKLKWNQAKEDISKKFATAIAILQNRESKLFNDVIREVSRKAIIRVIFKLKNQLGKGEQSSIITRKIKQLGD